jgi:hypothetical protein
VNLQTIIKRSVFAMAVLGATHALAQSVVTPKPVSPAPEQADSTPPANSNLPDACKLLAQADLEAFFPGRPIIAKARP